MGGITVRTGRPDDVAFLERMLAEAANWDPARPRLPLDEVLGRADLAHYVSGWGRPGDAVVVAEEEDGCPVGAAWYRRFRADDAGYGFLDESTPELAIGVVAEHRGRGVGGLLLAALAARARRDGHSALSLSVEVDNPAVALYRRHGFVVVATGEGAHTMRAELG